MRVVEQVLEAERAATGSAFASAKRCTSAQACAFQVPPPSSSSGILRRGQHRAQRVDLGGRRRRLHRLVAPGVGHRGHRHQHVLGQRQHHRAGAAAGGDLEGARDVFGDAVGAVDLRDPLGHLAVHAAVVDLLERLAVHEVEADLADEQDHRRRVLVGGVHADRGVGGARAARDEADARPARHLAVGFGHERGAAFLAVDDEADARVVQRVEHVEVALARHAEGGVDAVDLECVDQDLAAGAGWVGHVVMPLLVRARQTGASPILSEPFRPGF